VNSTGQVFVKEPLDYESQILYHIKVRARDQFGAEYIGEVGIELENAFLAILETQLPVFENGGIRMGGEVTNQGGLERISSTGVVLSNHPLHRKALENGEFQEFEIPLEPGASLFSKLIGLESIEFKRAGKLYLMAYAENSEGRSYGLEEVISVEPEPRTEDSWTGASALENRQGWWTSSWFGTYYRSEESGWLLHLGLGWMYPAPGANDGLWLWKEGVNWLWTGESVYPFLYRADTGTWMYFYGELNKKRLLYDYGLGRWTTLNEVEVDEGEGAR